MHQTGEIERNAGGASGKKWVRAQRFNSARDASISPSVGSPTHRLELFMPASPRGVQADSERYLGVTSAWSLRTLTAASACRCL